MAHKKNTLRRKFREFLDILPPTKIHENNFDKPFNCKASFKVIREGGDSGL